MKKTFFKSVSALSLIFIVALCGCNKAVDSDVTSSLPSESESSKEHGITFFGVEDATINLYEEFDLLDGVSATDAIDGELTVTVVDDDGFTNDFVGSYTIIYEAVNSIGQKLQAERSIAVSKGVNVQNGNFSYGKAYWTFDKPGGAGNIAFKNNEVVITVTNAGSEAWSMQLYQTGIAFEANKTYELTFKAKSTTGRSLSAGFENVGNNYSMMVSGYQAITLNANEDFVTYSVYCTPTTAVSNVKAVIYLGRNLDIDMTASKDNPIDVTIDDVSVNEITIDSIKAPVFENAGNVTVSTKDQFDALEEVKAYDYNGNDISENIEIVGEVPVSVSAQTGMMISYRVSDQEGNFNYVNRRISYTIAKENAWNLINEDFDNGTQGWISDVNQTNGSGRANYVAADGEMNIEIENGSSAGWHIQLYQTNISLTAQSIYRMTFVAKASVDRTVTLEISDPSNNYAVIYSEIYDLTTSYQTFILEYQPTKNYNAKVSLLLGGQGINTVTIDKLANEKITADEATQIDFRTYEEYQLVNGDFKYGYYSWNKTLDGTGNANFVANENQIVIHMLSNSDDWQVQLSQTGLTFTANQTYKIELIGYAKEATSVKLEISNDNGGTNVTTIKKETISLTETENTYSVEFTPTETYEKGKVALLLGEAQLTEIVISQIQVSLIA